MITELECFDPDYEGLFSRMAESIENGTPPSDEELVAVFKWKLGMTKQADANTVHSNGDVIRRALLDAGKDHTAKAALERLVQIKGIKLSVASALLTACYPDRYTVFDVRASAELQRAGIAERHQPWPPNAADWERDVDGYLARYVPAVREFQQENNLSTLRVADRTLWGRSVRRNIHEKLAEAR